MLNWIKTNRAFLIFLLCFGVFRTAVADWNPFPRAPCGPHFWRVTWSLSTAWPMT